MYYRWKLRLMKTRPWIAGTRTLQLATRRERLSPASLMTSFARGKTVADIGGMWSIDGAHTFVAADAGAIRVVCVDVRGATQRFELEAAKRASVVEHIQGDISRDDVIARVGKVDIVWCWGVLYHHPSPYQLLRNLYRICRSRIVIETLIIPEVRELPNAAVYFPYQADADRLWGAPRRARGSTEQYGITTGYRPELGYTNNFWGMSPSCIRDLMRTAGFEVTDTLPSPYGGFRKVFVGSVIPDTPDMG